MVTEKHVIPMYLGNCEETDCKYFRWSGDSYHDKNTECYCVLNNKRVYRNEVGEVHYICPMEKIWDEVEIMEVVHGRWVDKEDYYIETGVTCSICGERYWLEDYKTLYNYCPNCGADMRERKNND